MSSRRRSLSLGAVLLSALLAGGCGGTEPTQSAPRPVNTVSVTLAVPLVTTGHILQASAVPEDAQGDTLTGRPVTWSSSDTTIATVSTTGRVATVAAGTVDIIATSEGKSGRATLVIEEPVLSVVVLLPFDVLAVGQTVQAIAVTLGAGGDTLVGRPVGWGTSNPAAVKVSDSGFISAVGIGAAKITAVTESASGVAGVTVNETGTPTGSVTARGRQSPNQLPNR